MENRNTRFTRRLARRSAERGMTLIEIMIVILIMAMIATTVSIAVFSQLKDARVSDARIGACTIKNAVQLYRAKHPGKCPTMEDLKGDYLDSEKATKDPWENDYVIECSGRDPDVYSPGSDDNDNKQIRCAKEKDEE
jgi:general secretion pathway protein G